eukprot:TsM_000836900 transcript=TsM_000836900 gene=TsM_000836900
MDLRGVRGIKEEKEVLLSLMQLFPTKPATLDRSHGTVKKKAKKADCKSGMGKKPVSFAFEKGEAL